VVLRCTRKLLDLLRPTGSPAEIPASEDDWYASLVWLARSKCLLLAHAGTLFAVFRPHVSKPDLSPLGDYIVRALEAELVDEGLHQTPSADSTQPTCVWHQLRAGACSAS
jgi:Domain of unknown function (DUF6933)